MAEVAFNEERHEYTVDGHRWPSVTQILDPLLELDGIPKEALRAAARFGTHVHLAVHLWDLNQLDEEVLDPHLAPYLEGWKNFLRDTGAMVVNSELRVAHTQLKYAGTLDKAIFWKGRRHILDIKSGADVPWTVGMQTAAYLSAARQNAFEEVYSNIRFCVHLKPDATYRLHTLKDASDFNNFISVLNVHHLRSRHGRQPS